MGAVVVVGWRIDPSGRRSLLPAGGMVMLLAHALFMYGYCNTERGRSDGRPISEMVVAALPPDAPVWVFAEEGRFSRSPVDTAIYMNRVVEPTRELAALPTTRPLAIMVHCKANQSMPAELASWRVIGTSSKNKGVWHVCIPPGF
jgi:hypothetical protein